MFCLGSFFFFDFIRCSYRGFPKQNFQMRTAMRKTNVCICIQQGPRPACVSMQVGWVFAVQCVTLHIVSAYSHGQTVSTTADQALRCSQMGTHYFLCWIMTFSYKIYVSLTSLYCLVILIKEICSNTLHENLNPNKQKGTRHMQIA